MNKSLLEARPDGDKLTLTSGWETPPHWKVGKPGCKLVTSLPFSPSASRGSGAWVKLVPTPGLS